MDHQDDAYVMRILQEARTMANNRNRHRRNRGQSQGQNYYRHGGNGMRPNGADSYRPHDGHRQAQHQNQRPNYHHGQHRPRQQGPILPYQQRQHIPQQPLSQLFQCQFPPHILAQQQQTLIVPTQARQDSIVSLPSTSSPPAQIFQHPYNIFLDPNLLSGLNPPGVDEETWFQKSMQFIEDSSRYQRPETNVEEGTGWMGDIEAPGFEYEEDRVFDALQEFNLGLEIARDLEQVEQAIEELNDQQWDWQMPEETGAEGYGEPEGNDGPWWQ